MTLLIKCRGTAGCQARGAGAPSDVSERIHSAVCCSGSSLWGITAKETFISTKGEGGHKDLHVSLPSAPIVEWLWYIEGSVSPLACFFFFEFALNFRVLCTHYCWFMVLLWVSSSVFLMLGLLPLAHGKGPSASSIVPINPDQLQSQRVWLLSQANQCLKGISRLKLSICMYG